MNPFSLEGKVAIVTGANQGLGYGMAMALANAGADIIAISHAECDKIVPDVKALGRNCIGLTIDLMKQDKIDDLVEEAVKAMGHIDILVNNAGIIRRCDSIDFTEKDWDDVLNINLKTVFFLSQAVAKQFIKQNKGGKIINIASMLSYQGGIRVPSYTASKSAIKGITMTMANEWAKYNININAIAPGYMATDNTALLRSDEGRSNEILDRIPAARWGIPEDLGGPVVFLASKASDYVNGFTIAVDGGWLAR